jgi:uncharacterized Zn finger protein
MKPANIKKLQARARRLRTRKITRDTYVVFSVSRPNLQHIVTVQMGADGAIHARCTCPWSVYGGFGCAHVMAVLTSIAARKRRRISFWATEADAERQRHRVLRLAGSDDQLFITSRPLPRLKKRLPSAA